MRCLALFTVAAFSFTLQAQTQTAPGAADQTGQATAAATASTRISAEFTKKIDTKDARVGDEVSARLSFDAGLSDGTVLPKGTRLTGIVTDVRARSGSSGTAHLALNINQAILQDGRTIHLHSTLTSLAVPIQLAMAGDPSDMMSPSPGVGSRGPSIGAPTDLNAGTDTPSSVGKRGTTSTGRSAGGLGADTISKTAADTAADVPTAKPTGLNDPRAEGSPANGTYVSDALQVHHYAVKNMPGVILSSQATASVSGVLDAGNQNIRLESGTKMTMNVAVAAH